jgi:hypothetical protein
MDVGFILHTTIVSNVKGLYEKKVWRRFLPLELDLPLDSWRGRQDIGEMQQVWA